VGELAQLGGGVLCVFERLCHERRGTAAVILERALRQLERDDRVDQTLLGPVVQIANDPTALLSAARRSCSRGDLASDRVHVLSFVVGWIKRTQPGQVLGCVRFR